MTDPVADRNDDDERQVVELADLDAQLDAEHTRCVQAISGDPLRAYWFDVGEAG